jgi:septal ring-binding cell division protein DamX
MFNKNNLLRILIIPVIIFGLAGLGYYNYDNESSKPIVTIYPDIENTKIKPQEAGGLVIPNSDNTIYDSLQSQKNINKKVNILPEPEAPINIMHQRTLDEEGLDPIDKILASIISTGEGEAGKAQLNEQQVPDVILPDIIEMKPNTADEFVEEKTSTEKKGLNIIKITTKANKLEQEKAKPKKAFDHYKIQLASVKSESDAIKEGERIKAKNIKILNKSNITFRKVEDAKGNFFYLVLAGDYKSLSQAKSICKKLSNRQQNCIVTN